MSGETRTLAEFAAGLNYEDIPRPVVERAKDCLIDTIGAAVFGSTMPWSKIVAGYAKANGGGGACTDDIMIHDDDMMQSSSSYTSPLLCIVQYCMY